MADDVGWEAFGCYGGEDYQTPRLDDLAARGVRFAHCYSTPICTTSRVQIMTGKYNFRNYTHFGYLDPDEPTFGQLLRSAGYRTAIAGKWQLNGLYNSLPGHDDPSRVADAGFDEYCLWQVTQGKQTGGERYWSPLLETHKGPRSAVDNDGLYGPDLMSDFLCEFMTRDDDRPFFAYYPMVLVHSPFVPTPASIGDGKKSNKPGESPDSPKTNFAAMVEYMDAIVGRLVDTLDEAGKLDNTLILFTADNGTNRKLTSRWNGRDIKGGKGTTPDAGTHVPLIAYWRGRGPTGVVTDDLVDFTDFYPTLAEAAGATPPDGHTFDGVSFLPRIRGETATPRDWVLCSYQPYWGDRGPDVFARTAEFKLYRDGRLYHVPFDLKEKEDLAGDIPGGLSAATLSRLKALVDSCPPLPAEGSRRTVDRPVYPEAELAE